MVSRCKCRMLVFPTISIQRVTIELSSSLLRRDMPGRIALLAFGAIAMLVRRRRFGS